jgi:hypothetical protein
MKIDLIRVASLKSGTFGVLKCDGIPFAVTAELPDRNNERNVSCIPVGVYTCKRVKTPSHGNTFEVKAVKGRSAILFHVGNIPLKDSEGCILIGEQFEELQGKDAVLASRKGFGEFLDKTSEVDEFMLSIIEIKT